MKPTQKQIDFAQTIAEELGIDPPEGEDREGYSSWISGLVDEFYKQRNERRYSQKECFEMEHAHHYDEHSYDKLNKNPKTR